MRTSFIETLCGVAEQDERVWLLTADLGYSVLEVFRERFPRRARLIGANTSHKSGSRSGSAGRN